MTLSRFPIVDASGGVVSVSAGLNLNDSGTAIDPVLNLDTDISLDNITLSQDLLVMGNITAQGDKALIYTTEFNVADAYVYMNSGYLSASATTGGSAINIRAPGPSDEVDGAFTAGVPSTSNPTVVTASSGVIPAGKLIQISNSPNNLNDGLYESLSHVGTLLTIRGIGVTGTVEAFTQNQFTADAGGVGDIDVIEVSVAQAGTDGKWGQAFGSDTGFVFENFAVGETIYTGSGTVTGDTTVTGENGDFIQLASYDLTNSDFNSQASISTNEQQAIFAINSGDGAGGVTGRSRLRFTLTDMFIEDGINEKGLVYVDGDAYALNFVDDSLIHKKFADDTYLALAGGMMTGDINMDGLSVLGATGLQVTENNFSVTLAASVSASQDYNFIFPPELMMTDNHVITSDSAGMLSFGVQLSSPSAGSLAVGVDGSAITGINNIVIGSGAGDALVAGFGNTLIGDSAAVNIVGSDNNTCVGVSAGAALTANTSNGNTFIGEEAGHDATPAAAGTANNVGLGRSALQNIGAGATNNLVLGTLSANSGVTGNNNSILGAGSAQDLTSGSFNIVIGSSLDLPSPTIDEFLTIGDLIFGDMDTGAVRIGGSGTLDPMHSLALDSTTQSMKLNPLTNTAEGNLDPGVGQLFFNTSRQANRVETSTGFKYASFPDEDKLICVRDIQDLIDKYGDPGAGNAFTMVSGDVLIVEGTVDIDDHSIEVVDNCAVVGSSYVTSQITSTNATSTLSFVGAGSFPSLPAFLTDVLVDNTGAGDAVLIDGVDAVLVCRASKFDDMLTVNDFSVLRISTSLWADTGVVFNNTSANGIVDFIQCGFLQTGAVANLSSVELVGAITIDNMSFLNTDWQNNSATGVGVDIGTATINKGSISGGAFLTGVGATFNVGFDQTSDEWIVLDFDGLPDSGANGIGDVVSTSTVTNVPQATPDTWTDIDDGSTELTWTQEGVPEKIDLDSTDTGQQSYAGVRDRNLKVSASLAFEGVNNGDLLTIGISIGGADPTEDTTTTVGYVNATRGQITIIPTPIAVTNGDAVKLQFKTNGNAGIDVASAKSIVSF